MGSSGRMSYSGLYCMIIATVRGVRVDHEEPRRVEGRR